MLLKKQIKAAQSFLIKQDRATVIPIMCHHVSLVCGFEEFVVRESWYISESEAYPVVATVLRR